MTTIFALEEVERFCRDAMPDDPAYVRAMFNRWLERGDGIAVYENVDLGSLGLGHRVYVSFGSPDAQLEGETPPDRLPDIGTSVNWRYVLIGTYRGEVLS